MAKLVLFKRKFVPKDDAQMVAAMMAGDEAAIEYVFYDHYNPMLRSLANYTFNRWGASREKSITYKDLISELYLHLSKDDWRILKRYNPENPFEPWFSIVASRYFKDYYKKINPQMIDSLAEIPKDIMSSGESLEDCELMRDLMRVLPFLEPPRYREILEELIIEDKDPEEVAKRHNITIDNLYNIKKRALAKLIQKYLTGYKNNR